ncbi:MAG: Hint domain-containing protein [Deltaproteobacteria bacterium]
MNALEKKLFKEAQKNGGTLKLDFKNDEHYEYYMSKLEKNGASLQTTPHLMKLIEIERNKANFNVELNKEDIVTGPVDDAFITLPYYLGSSPNIKNCYAVQSTCSKSDNESPTSMFALVKASYINEQRSVILDYTVYDEINKINVVSDTVPFSDCKDPSTEIQADIGSLLDGKPRKYSISGLFTEVAENCSGKTELNATLTTNQSVVINTDIVKKLTLNAPVPKPEYQKHEQVKVSYKRDSQVGEFDYSYDNEPFKYNNKKYIRFLLDVSLTLEVNGGFEIVGLDTDYGYRLNIRHPDGGSIKYSVANAKISIDPSNHAKATVSLAPVYDEQLKKEIDAFWGVSLELLEDQISDNLDIYGQFAFLVSPKGSSNLFSVSTSFTSISSGFKPTPSNIKSLPIYIQWGCLGKDTLITLANGSSAKISEINIGSSIMSVNGEERKVVDIITGKDETILSVTTETGRNILMTSDHSIKTPSGWITAGELSEGMEVECEKGIEVIMNVVEEQYNDIVYNLKFEEETGIIGNGFIIGDYDMQQRIKPQREKVSIIWSKETNAVALELEKLAEMR